MARTIKKYAAFSKAQQDIYENDLNDQQRAYIENRVHGSNKADSYRIAYKYGGNNAGQNAKNLETRTPIIVELVDTILNAQKVLELETAKKGGLNEVIDAKAKQDGIEKVIKAVDGADSEEAKRIQFYRDIINGKIKSVKTTTRRNANGKVLSITTVESDDTSAKLQARKELDRVLGLNKVVQLDEIMSGGLTIQIVDATKKADKIETSDNNIELKEEDFVEVSEDEVEVDE